MNHTSFELMTNEPVIQPLLDEGLPPAWEEVAPGRFRPRRVRGSYVGRELG